jgi:hypothetical protein
VALARKEMVRGFAPGAGAGGRVRLRTLSNLRWLAVAGQSAALFLVYFALGYSLPILYCAVAIAISAGLNVVLAVRYAPAHRLTNREATFYLAFDVLQLAALLYLTGGIANPFALMFLGPVVIDRRSREVRGGIDEAELLAARLARRGGEHRERAEHLLVRRLDRCRPARAQPARDDRVAKEVPLRIAEDVGDQRLRSRQVLHLTPEQACHHFDAGERILQLVRDARGHLAERRQAVAQALALDELFHLGEILEEHHAADSRSLIVAHLRQRVPDDTIEILEPQLCAVRQVAELERARQHADDRGPFAQHFHEGAADVRGMSRQRENPVRLVVHQRERAVAPEGDDAVAQAVDDVTEEAIVGIGDPWRDTALGSRTGPQGAFRPSRPGIARAVHSLGHVVKRLMHVICDPRSEEARDMPGSLAPKSAQTTAKSAAYGSAVGS